MDFEGELDELIKTYTAIADTVNEKTVSTFKLFCDVFSFYIFYIITGKPITIG